MPRTGGIHRCLPTPPSLLFRSRIGGSASVTAIPGGKQQQRKEDGFGQDVKDAVENAFPVEG